MWLTLPLPIIIIIPNVIIINHNQNDKPQMDYALFYENYYI